MSNPDNSSIGLAVAERALANVVTEGNPDLAERCRRLSQLLQLFSTLYGEHNVSFLRAPARINILGEHVDYVSYLPTASLTFSSRQRDTLMVYAPSGSQIVRGASTDPRFATSSFSLDSRVPSLNENVAIEWLQYLSRLGAQKPNWLNYVKGSVYFALGKFGGSVVDGFNFAVDSNIPAGGGASSSSALVVLAGAAIRDLNHVLYTPEELAGDSAMAEWFVGTRGGSMDHKTICLSEASHGVLISYSTGAIERVTLPEEPFQWITFFSKPADKGHAVMLQYNERAAVSRLLLPALIHKQTQSNSAFDKRWTQVGASLAAGSLEMYEAAEALLKQLPETITREQLKMELPDTFVELERAFPELCAEESCWPMPICARALHHLGETKRVRLAAQRLRALGDNSTPDEQLSTMREIGELLNESHMSLRDLYGVSTNEVEDLISIIRSDKNVLGARLMGGGFGGNVLALMTRAHAQDLIHRVQSDYYEPQNRDGVDEGSIMVSTPGPGLSHFDLKDLWRESISYINSLGPKAAKYSLNLRSLLDSLPNPANTFDIWPVIVAAGRGTRAAASGLTLSKPVAPVLNQPAILHVLRTIQVALGKTRPPIVIVSPETEKDVRNALADEDVIFVIQPEALGTGDAVLRTREKLSAFDGRTLVVWSTQPVIQPATVVRTVKLANLFDAAKMVLPTTLKEQPYAPISRGDGGGAVSSSVETNLEGAAPIDFGETNLGLFLVQNIALFDVLLALKERYWDVPSGSYKRPSGELGFPNELINAFAKQRSGVIASPFADWREEQGIKQLSDLRRCEQYIQELLLEGGA